jgi:hypothetical protein
MGPSALLALKGIATPAEPRRRGSAFVASLVLHLGLTMLIVFGISLRSGPVVTQSPVPTQLVYVVEAGPGGGGGGSPAPASPKQMEIPRHRAPDPVPVEVQPLPDRIPPEPALDTPIMTNAAAILSAAGRSIGLPGQAADRPERASDPEQAPARVPAAAVGPGVGRSGSAMA